MELWAVVLIGMACAATFATAVLAALWRADSAYRRRRAVSRGWLAATLAVSSIMVLVPSWYFAASLVWRIANNLRAMPPEWTPISVFMVVLALGSPVFLAVRVLGARWRQHHD